MGVLTFEDETTSTIAPVRLYKALVKDGDNLIPKIIEAIKNVEIVEGNGGPETIKKITFVEDEKTKYLLHKVETIDEANLIYNYSIIGGVGLPDIMKKITFETKLVDGPGGGSIAKKTIKYHHKGDTIPSEEELKAGKTKGDALFKAIEDYVLANPDYN